ncbi:MAG: hypothetical protein AB7P34_19585 [Vicinamibacterales bacterium]
MSEAGPDGTTVILSRRDVAITVLVGAAGAMLAWALSLMLVFTEGHLDVWFESDSVYILSQITDRLSEYNQSNGHHPLYPLIGFGTMWILGDWLGVADAVGTRLLLFTSSALFAASMFAALRLLNRPRPVALLFTAVLLLTSPGLLFLGIHERLIPGGLTVLLCVIAAAAWRRGLAPRWPVVAAAALALGITITNFMTATLLVAATTRIRQAARLLVLAFAIVQVLSLVTVLTFPRSTVFPYPGTWPWFSSIWTDLDDIEYRAGTMAQKSTAFWMHSVVMPDARVQTKLVAEPVMRYVSFQHVPLAAHRWPGVAALAAWLVTLAAGLVLAVRGGEAIELALAAALGAQWCLFIVFGEETVLYAPYYVPLAMLLASKAAAAGWHDWRVRVAMVAWPLLLAWNNLTVFAQARATALGLL